MKLVVVLGDPETSILARLTKFFTGCNAYHVGFLDEETNLFYDMYWLRRRRKWPRYDGKSLVMCDIPCVTREYLENKLSEDDTEYGYIDYLKFAVRPIYHLFGKSTKNAGGMICSEMAVSDIHECGGVTPFDLSKSPPSPCDILKWMLDSNLELS